MTAADEMINSLYTTIANGLYSTVQTDSNRENETKDKYIMNTYNVRYVSLWSI